MILVKKMKDNIKIISYTGQNLGDLIPQIAALRIEVFAEYPFLYAGDINYEMQYLKKFLTMENAIVVVALDQDVPIGISTGYPFVYENQNLQQAFLSSERNPKDHFCFGESVLRKSYRGLGIGKRFFDEREAHVQKLGHYHSICFYTSARPLDDPKCPADYRPLGPFWNSRGYVEHPELTASVSYQEIGEQEETPKRMIFWIKELQKMT